MDDAVWLLLTCGRHRWEFAPTGADMYNFVEECHFTWIHTVQRIYQASHTYPECAPSVDDAVFGECYDIAVNCATLHHFLGSATLPGYIKFKGFIKLRTLTLNVPHAWTMPSLVSAAVWLSPALICTTLVESVTLPGSIQSSSSAVVRPSAPSSLQPHVYTCEKTHFLLNTHIASYIICTCLSKLGIQCRANTKMSLRCFSYQKH